VAFARQLRVQAKRRILRPCLWRGRDRERDDTVAIAIGNQRRGIGEQIDVAIKIEAVLRRRSFGTHHGAAGYPS